MTEFGRVILGQHHPANVHGLADVDRTSQAQLLLMTGVDAMHLDIHATIPRHNDIGIHTLQGASEGNKKEKYSAVFYSPTPKSGTR